MKATTPVAVLVEASIETDLGQNGPEHEDSIARGEVSTQGESPAGSANFKMTADSDPLALLDPALDFQLDAFVVFRAETDPYLAAYANACGYSLEAATADQQTSWWVGAR